VKKLVVYSGITALFAAGMLFVGIVLAQQSGQDSINVTISDTALIVSPATPNLTANTPFTLTVQNTGTFTYSLVLEKPGDVNQPLQTAAGPARMDNIAPGQSQTETWTIADPGTYQFAAYTSTTATTASVLTATVVVNSASGSPDVTGTVAVTGTTGATSVATDTPAATTAATSTVAATDTPAATSTTEATATSAATSTAAATDTPAATSTLEPTSVTTGTGAITATATVSGTAEATLPQTGGPDDSLPMGILLITFGTLFVVGGLLVGRKLARGR
jgi:hypothetical protein